jgi:DNA-binding NarL/FixJ family response regulator
MGIDRDDGLRATLRPEGAALPIRVLLVDDQEFYRSAIRAYLDRVPDVTVVAEAADGRTGIRLAAELEPDVVLMDVSLPDLDGIEATRRIKQHRPATAVVALSGLDDEVTRTASRHAGASGVLDKVSPLETLMTTIRAAAGSR